MTQLKEAKELTGSRVLVQEDTLMAKQSSPNITESPCSEQSKKDSKKKREDSERYYVYYEHLTSQGYWFPVFSIIPRWRLLFQLGHKKIDPFRPNSQIREYHLIGNAVHASQILGEWSSNPLTNVLLEQFRTIPISLSSVTITEKERLELEKTLERTHTIWNQLLEKKLRPRICSEAALVCVESGRGLDEEMKGLVEQTRRTRHITFFIDLFREQYKESLRFKKIKNPF